MAEHNNQIGANESTPLVVIKDGKGDDVNPKKYKRENSSPNKNVFRCIYGGNYLLDDLKHIADPSRAGSIPHSLVVGAVVALTCGFAAFLYYKFLFGMLDLVWDFIPSHFIEGVWPESAYIWWIPIVVFTSSILNGLSVRFVGEPGDLAYTIDCVHHKAYVALNHVFPMLVASTCSIVGGGSLGPEAPLVAICAALSGFVSRTIFKTQQKNVIRKHTLMGMSGSLSAFFGAPLGGSLFALEVCSRFGIEYFEHTIEAIFVGILTLFVFRGLNHLNMAPIWTLTENRLEESSVLDLLTGGLIGLLAAGVSFLFTLGHFSLMFLMGKVGLLDNKVAPLRALVGATVISILGVLIPHTMFWGEEEIQVIATGAPTAELPNVFPKRGLTGFEMDSCAKCVLVGFAKLVAIAFSVAGGLRGGFIFPLFSAGTAFGRSLTYIFPRIPPAISCLSFASALNVAITKTSMASPLIIVFLAGDIYAFPSVLTASLVSIMATAYMPFIKTQTAREDLEDSLEEENVSWSIRNVTASHRKAVLVMDNQESTDDMLDEDSQATEGEQGDAAEGDVSVGGAPKTRTRHISNMGLSMKQVSQRGYFL